MANKNKPLVMVVGSSGSGKSTSLRNLDPASTHILDLERKGFPFPNADAFGNIHNIENMGQFNTALNAALTDPACRVIVIESFTKYTEILLSLAQTSYKGYDIWNFYNKAIRDMLDKVKNTQSIVVFTAIDEIVRIPQPDGSETAQRRVKVQGKQHEGNVEKEALMVLFTEPRRDTKLGKIAYMFQTNTDGLTSAKTPMGMFNDTLVPNDLATVLDIAEKYYLAAKTAARLVPPATAPAVP